MASTGLINLEPMKWGGKDLTMVASKGPQQRKRTRRGWSIEQAAKLLSVLAEELVLKSETTRALLPGS